MGQNNKIFIVVWRKGTERELLWVSSYKGRVSFGPSPPKEAVPELQQRGYSDALIRTHILGYDIEGNTVKDIIHGTYHRSGWFRPAYDNEMKQAGFSFARQMQPPNTLTGIICIGQFGYKTDDIGLQPMTKAGRRIISFNLDGVVHFQISLFLIAPNLKEAFCSSYETSVLLDWRIKRFTEALNNILLGIEFCGTSST